MQIQETFTVDAPLGAVWQFFENVERVGRCVPGVQSVSVLDQNRYRVVATQKVGFISATFEMVTRVDRKEPMKFMEFSSTGRSVKGAIANVTSRDRVDLEPLPGGDTRVRLTSEVVVSGMLGALGHKAIMAKSREITEKFAQALGTELRSVSGARPA